MNTSAALLILCLFHFCLATVQELDHHAGKNNGSEIPKIEPPCACAGDMTGSRENYCRFAVIIGELEAKLRNTEKQLEDLRGEVRASQGSQVAFGASTGISANFGPFNAGFTLAYKNVYLNTGMYTPTTVNSAQLLASTCSSLQPSTTTTTVLHLCLHHQVPSTQVLTLPEHCMLQRNYEVLTTSLPRASSAFPSYKFPLCTFSKCLFTPTPCPIPT
ncbi:uncharacterized protein LOC143329317 [Chaetodon auriga]|uniref:uncharacterized protein LOC143329317 n=1 Tax=Chaetodon auriga TaxID=39042 RepID=UPI0040328FB4